jgi:starvation-inducible DNA-binding protein
MALTKTELKELRELLEAKHAELREDNAALLASLRAAHDLCDTHRDVGTASFLEVWIDETERRAWFLYESSARPDSGAR